MAQAPCFMGVLIPKDWSIITNPSTGTLTLREGAHSHSGYTAIEVRNRLISYHRMEKENEQHRQSNQTARSPAPPQSAPGNPWGTAVQSSARVTLYAQQGAQQAVVSSSPSPFQGAGGGGISTLQQAIVANNALLQALQQERPLQTPLPRTAPQVGEIIGHRAWLVRNSVLRSVSMDTVWHPGCVIHDYFGENLLIDDHNAAGIWAFKDPYDLGSEFAPFFHSSIPICLGTIWMWGTVIEHERGYRSQFASIRSLERVTRETCLEALRQHYKV